MKEYIIKTGTHSDVQKWLNQWRHNYELEIIEFKFNEDKTASFVLVRTPKS